VGDFTPLTRESRQDYLLQYLFLTITFKTTLFCTLLIAKLKYIGFPVDTIDWVNSYLSNRSQQVTINTESGIVTSQHRKITNGVPQGSILASLLFVIYTFDFHHIINIQYYADDT
jgi:hypothetical protein